MGAARQLRRAVQDLLDSFVGIFKRKKKRSRKSSEPEMVKLHKSWKKGSPAAHKKNRVHVIEQQKMRVPGLRQFKRIAAAFLLFINFVFSQFLLGSIGDGSQGMFLLFLGNSAILVDYIWKTRSIKKQ